MTWATPPWEKPRESAVEDAGEHRRTAFWRRHWKEWVAYLKGISKKSFHQNKTPPTLKMWGEGSFFERKI